LEIAEHSAEEVFSGCLYRRQGRNNLHNYLLDCEHLVNVYPGYCVVFADVVLDNTSAKLYWLTCQSEDRGSHTKMLDTVSSNASAESLRGEAVSDDSVLSIVSLGYVLFALEF